MLNLLLVWLYFGIKKHSEDVLLYITAFTGSFIYTLSWSKIVEATIISCISATVPLFIKHLYNIYFTNEREK